MNAKNIVRDATYSMGLYLLVAYMYVKMDFLVRMDLLVRIRVGEIIQMQIRLHCLKFWKVGSTSIPFA